MYYSSESSDSETAHDSKSLDLSYLMLDSHSLGIHLRNSVRELYQAKSNRITYRHSSNYNNANATELTSASRSENDQESLIKNNEDTLPSNSETIQASKDTIEELRSCTKITTASQAKSNNETESNGILLKDSITEKLFLNHNLIINTPFELVLFQKLKFVDISNNNISHVNDFILHLPELQTLYLKNNQIVDDGLPKEMSVLSKLKELNLSGNLLTQVPPQLCEVASLRYLYLGNNLISELRPEIKALQNLQVLHLGGNSLTSVPDDVGELSSLCALVLSNNRLQRLPRAISNLSKLRSLLLHNNNLCTLPVEIVKLGGISELSLRDNPLVTRFVNSYAKDLLYNPPSLKELAARTVRQKRVPYTPQDLPGTLNGYLSSGHKCVNPKCKGVYFTSCVEHIKFVDFCGMYRVPLMHYLCSSRCTSQTPSYYRNSGANDDSDDDVQDANMRKVLLG